MRQGLSLQHVIRMLVLALLCAGVSARVWLNLLSWISHAESKGFSLKNKHKPQRSHPIASSLWSINVAHLSFSSVSLLGIQRRNPKNGSITRRRQDGCEMSLLRKVRALQSSSMTIINVSVMKRTSLNFLCLKPPAASCQALVLQICYENWNKQIAGVPSSPFHHSKITSKHHISEIWSIKSSIITISRIFCWKGEASYPCGSHQGTPDFGLSKLLDGILTGQQVRRDDANGCEPGHHCGTVETSALSTKRGSSLTTKIEGLRNKNGNEIKWSPPPHPRNIPHGTLPCFTGPHGESAVVQLLKSSSAQAARTQQPTKVA